MKAQDMDAVFVAMPDQYVPQLENAWRKDLIDLYNSGKEAKLKNTMNGFSTLKKLTDDYLLLQVTDRSTVEMKLLPLVNDTYVVCMVTTVYGPIPDSQVEFLRQTGSRWMLPICTPRSRQNGLLKMMPTRTVPPLSKRPPVWIWTCGNTRLVPTTRR